MSVGFSGHRLRRHGPGPAGGLPHRPDPEAGRRGERGAGRRPRPLLEDAADAGEGQPAGSEPLGAQSEGPGLEGGPAHRHQPGGAGHAGRAARPGGAGAGPIRSGEAVSGLSSLLIKTVVSNRVGVGPGPNVTSSFPRQDSQFVCLELDEAGVKEVLKKMADIQSSLARLAPHP